MKTSLFDVLNEVSQDNRISKAAIEKIEQEFDKPIYDTWEDKTQLPISEIWLSPSDVHQDVSIPDFRGAIRVVYWIEQKELKTDKIVGLAVFEDNACKVFAARILPR